jgi:hypothetical protein
MKARGKHIVAAVAGLILSVWLVSTVSAYLLPWL